MGPSRDGERPRPERRGTPWVSPGNKTHDDACASAESAGTTQAAQDAAHVFFISVIAGCKANGLPYAPFLEPLKRLGVDPG